MALVPPWVIAIGAIVGALFIAAIGFMLWAYIFRKRKNYPFLLYSRNCKDRRVIYAALKVDPNNKENKLFAFPGVDTRLALREPTCFQDGKGYREIIQNKAGGYSYIKGAKLDEKEYIQLSLNADEKALALHRLKENEARYQNPMGKMQAAVLITGFIMIILLSIGIIYSTIAYVGAGKHVVKVVETNNKMQTTQTAQLDRMAVITEQLTAITGALTSDYNITRRVS